MTIQSGMTPASPELRPTIGLLTSVDSRRLGPNWAATGHYMAKTMQEHCGNVVHLDPLHSPVRVAGKAANRVARELFGRAYDFSSTILQARDWSRVLTPRLHGIDVILAASAAPQIALLDTDIPIVYTSDATFALVADYYPFYTGLPPWNSRIAQELEARVLRGAALLVYPSEWAAHSARTDYGIGADKVHVLPYGANFDEIPSRAVATASRTESVCRLLFVGVDWERKGGDIAYETLQALRTGGIDAELTIVGCEPPRGVDRGSLRVVGNLNKEIRSEREQLSRLYLESDFLLLPTRAECYGMVFCEASAHGTPSITTDTGGVAGAVRHGENGILLPSSADGRAYAAVIAELAGDRSRYDTLVRSSRDAYEERLNWDSWGRRLSPLISTLVEGHRRGASERRLRGAPDGVEAASIP
jgi:glycosyltransferase involved in cell wall biosynthesis